MANKRGNKFQARVNETGGKYHRYSFDTYEEATLWEEQARGQKALGLPITSPRQTEAPKTFAQFYATEQPKLWGPKNKSNTVVNAIEKYYPDLLIAKLD